MLSPSVAPFVGAWIETLFPAAICCALRSLPSWERGLKRTPCRSYTSTRRSLPSWERGLKPEYVGAQVERLMSLPSWERGLKPGNLILAFFPCPVAPFVGAWIETNAF